MTPSRKPVSSRFEEIKRAFDPAFSYVIFEKITDSSERSEFREVFDAIEHLDLGFHERKVFRDEARGRLLLVIKFHPDRTDRIMEEFMNIGLPEDITFYAYGGLGTK